MPFDNPPIATQTRLRPALVADLFCGAGGSSTGAQRALAAVGRKMELVCVNHWDRAIETHKLNHPGARHYCMDLSSAKPIEIVPEGRLDLLMASPTCTFHSRARGGKPVNDQQRMDPWHVIQWLTDLRVSRVVIENVPEFVEWGPCDARTGRPIKSRRGEYFRAWVAVLEGLGFKVEWRILNAADYGDATTRKRFFLIARSDDKKLEWPRATHAPASKAAMLGLKPWRPARDIIDWNISGRSIFGRKRPLAPKTLARIYAGAVKFKWPNAFLVILRNHMDGQSVDGPLPALCASGLHVGLAEPVGDPFVLSQQSSGAPRDLDQPLPTITTGGASSTHRPGCARHAVAEAFICGCGGRAGQSAPTGEGDPLGTITAKNDRCLVEAFIATVAHGTAEGDTNHGRRARSIDDPLPTVAGEGGQFAVVEPFILNRHGDNGSTRAHSVEEPAPTADCRGAGYLVEPVVNPAEQLWHCKTCGEDFIDVHAGTEPGGLAPPECPKCAEEVLLEPFVLSQASGGAPRSVDDPTPTNVAAGATALIAPYYGSGSGETCRSAEEPLPTATAKARFGMVVPVTHGEGGGPGARDVDEPLPTLTTAKGGEFAMVMPVTHAGGINRAQDTDDPLPTITGAHRGELSFIAAQFGEREGQAPRVHSVDEPTPTITASGHTNLVIAEPVLDSGHCDILFRMLEPKELAAAMGFSDDEAAYEFAGNKTEITKQIGNAVPVNTAAALVAALMRL